MKRVLITGAGGFVGRALTTGFAALGWEVVALDRAFDEASAEEPTADGRIQRVVVELDLDVPVSVPAVDLIVYGAWLTTSPEALRITHADYRYANLTPLLACLRWALEVEPRAFVFLSSSGVFGPDDGADGLTDRDEPTGTSSYGRVKRACEDIVTDTVNEEVTDAFVVRLGYLYGPGEAPRPSRQGVSLAAQWLAAARDGRPLEVRADDPIRDWTFTPDLAAAIARLVDGPATGRPIHLGSPHMLRDSEFAGLIADVFAEGEVVRVAAGEAVKPAMVPSDVEALRGFEWTHPSEGIHLLLDDEAAA